MKKVDQYPPTFPPTGPPVDLDHFRARVVQDALTDATAGYWLRRAAQFEWAKSRPGEPLGSDRTEMDRAAHDRELDRIAAACRVKAAALTNRWEAA